MKINYKNTALSILDDTKTFPFYLPEYTKEMNFVEEEKFKYSIRMAVSTSGFIESWKSNVQYVTRPFWDAYAKSQGKIKSVVQETEFEDAGTLIIPWKNHTQTIFYALRTNGKKGEEWDYEVLIQMFTKSPHHHEFGLDLFVYMAKQGEDFRERIWKGFVEQRRDSSYWIADLMCFKTFLKYVDVETKIVNANKKEKHLGEKYVNETNYKVQILDSTYFTTISRTEGFGVSGHFRLQPWGPGLTQKRLQWISAYEKDGYTKRAKILIQ
jgi:hypothetical protein